MQYFLIRILKIKPRRRKHGIQDLYFDTMPEPGFVTIELEVYALRPPV